MSDQSIEQAVARTIAEDFASECNGVSVETFASATDNFAFAFTAWTGEEVQTYEAMRLARSLSDEDRARLVFQLITEQCDARFENGLSSDDKKFGVTMADTMGPDYAQWLYHFAVFCTKAV
jgi:hypothetical protein